MQAELEGALATVLRLPHLRVTCAGRTDAGVHARGQVVHLDLPASAYDGDAHALGRRLAGVLPPDIGVRDVGVAPPGFDARFSPLWRRYAYRVSDHPFGPEPLRRHDVLGHRRRLDDAAMNEAAHRLLGRARLRGVLPAARGCHDGPDADRASPGPGPTTGCWSPGSSPTRSATAWSAPWSAPASRSARAAATAAWPGQVLAGRERLPDVSVAPARGLTLEEVRYPTVEELADRAAATRRKREVPS